MPSLISGISRALASGEVTKTNRAGVLFTAVGPNLVRSYSLRSSSSGTGRSDQALRVRASVNSWARAASVSGRSRTGVESKAMGKSLLNGISNSSDC